MDILERKVEKKREKKEREEKELREKKKNIKKKRMFVFVAQILEALNFKY